MVASLSWVTAALAVVLGAAPATQQVPANPASPPAPASVLQQAQTPQRGRGFTPNFAAEEQRQARSDATWQQAAEGVMQFEQTSYKSKKDGLTIPAYIFKPLTLRGAKGHAALVWVHPDIRGYMYEYYIPYVREAVEKGYIVIAPEYRGSRGFGEAFWNDIDYGGAEVDDVVTAVDVLERIPEVDPARIGIIGWSHGGMITLLSIERNPTTFKAAAALVPVTNLFQRLAWKGVERQHQAIDPQNRYGGLPNDRNAQPVYENRSPLYGVDKIQIPVLVHVTRNDQDVNIEEDMQMVDAVRSQKPLLASTMVYDNPLGGHLFDRQCPEQLSPRTVDPTDLKSYVPTGTREQLDSWNRVWTFLDWNLDPAHDAANAFKGSAELMGKRDR
jgi:dienelactone hydrolase